MITVQVRGGLGNQMFQYAAGRAAALRLDTDLGLDLRWFDRSPAFGFGLGHYPIRATTVPPRNTRLAPLPIPSRVGDARARALLLLRLGPDVLAEAGAAFDPRLLEAPDDTYLVGYWQSERYFADFADQIRAELSLPDPPSGPNHAVAKAIRGRPSVSVHVRRGDYVGSSTHPVCSRDYYQSAMAELRERLPDPQFFLFSDDPQWCHEHLAGKGDVVVSHNGAGTGHEDLRLMSLCDAHVIANSSFSWWGAWLGAPGPTIAPKRWFADDRDASAIVPARWDLR